MKRTLLIISLCVLCFGAGYSTQSTSNFSVRWTFTAADAAAVDDAEVRYLASAVMGSGADADIYQRDANGNIELDNVGRKKIAKRTGACCSKPKLPAPNSDHGKRNVR